MSSNFWTRRRLNFRTVSRGDSAWTEHLNAQILNLSKIRPIPCDCSLTYIAFLTLSLQGFLNMSAWEAMRIKELLGYVVHKVTATLAYYPGPRGFF